MILVMMTHAAGPSGTGSQQQTTLDMNNNNHETISKNECMKQLDAARIMIEMTMMLMLMLMIMMLMMMMMTTILISMKS